MLRHRVMPAALAGVWTIAALPSLAQAATIGCHGAENVCRTLIAGERELASMLVSDDVDIVARLFADDAVWTIASGERWTKREAIIALRSAPRMASSRLVAARVHRHGAVAIVQWREGWRTSATANEQQSFGTDTWMRRNGRWQIIASQEARLPTRVAP